MPDRTCMIEECTKPPRARRMCHAHYYHWRKANPVGQRPPAPRFARDFWDFVNKTHEHGCWLWTGVTQDKGYGMWGRKLAHRFSWALANGPIPNNMWILHHCDNPPCVNPAHLYPGTNVENTRDRVTRGRTANQYKDNRPTQCPQGHQYTGDNVRLIGKRRARVCRTCDNERSRKKMAERRKTNPKPLKARDSRAVGHHVVHNGPGVWSCSCGCFLATTERVARLEMSGHRAEIHQGRKVRDSADH